MKRLKSPKPEKAVLNTISYFSFFSYLPDFEQIFAFFPLNTTKKQLQTVLQQMVRSKKLIRYPFFTEKPLPGDLNMSQKDKNSLINSYLYTIPQYSTLYIKRLSRKEITKNKLIHILPYIEALSRLSFIRYIGISGSASMDNCTKADDVDLCIITSPNLLFTGRFLAILLSILFGVRNPRNGVCLNLFFDEQNMAVPKEKQTLYVAHEILQMKPVVNKNRIYENFLHKNRFVRSYFPNTRIPSIKAGRPGTHFVAYMLQPFEWIQKQIQLAIIRKNRTGHRVTPTQLWLFRKDFAKKHNGIFK